MDGGGCHTPSEASGLLTPKTSDLEVSVLRAGAVSPGHPNRDRKLKRHEQECKKLVVRYMSVFVQYSGHVEEFND